jgi:AraC family transcriptional regulator
MVATAHVLFSSDLIKVSDFTCDTPKSGCGCERCDARSSITIMRRGVHAYHARGRVALGEAGLALLYRGGEVYRLSHPYHRDVPDRSTCIEFDEAILEEAFGSEPLEQDLGTHIGPGTHLLNFQLMAALREAALDRTGSEEAALTLIRAIAADFRSPPDGMRGSRAEVARRRVERAREFIASRLDRDHGMAAIAKVAATSPFHLARLFKQNTGMTIRGYRLRLRLAAALERIAEGEPDLARLAAELGFSHHSHLTAAFRRHFGMPPSVLRERWGSKGLRRKSRFLTARAGQQP